LLEYLSLILDCLDRGAAPVHHFAGGYLYSSAETFWGMILLVWPCTVFLSLFLEMGESDNAKSLLLTKRTSIGEYARQHE
jgi:hypothetical protein